MRSSPMPVSIDGLGRSMRVFSSICSNCMKTRFQNSRNRSPSSSGEPGGPPATAVALIVEYFGVVAARSCRPHRPQIALMADDARVGKSGDLLPQTPRDIVCRMNRDPQPLLGQRDGVAHIVPGIFDRGFLEIVAEREIAEHLEKGVMPRGVADIVEIVVLAAGPHAFLHAGRARVGPLLGTGESVLELHHAGIGEEQRRIVARHERRGGDDRVLAVPEEFQKGGADIGKACHGPVLAFARRHCHPATPHAGPAGRQDGCPDLA